MIYQRIFLHQILQVWNNIYITLTNIKSIIWKRGIFSSTSTFVLLKMLYKPLGIRLFFWVLMLLFLVTVTLFATERIIITIFYSQSALNWHYYLSCILVPSSNQGIQNQTELLECTVEIKPFMFRVGFIRLDLSHVFRVLITALEILSIEYTA